MTGPGREPARQGGLQAPTAGGLENARPMTARRAAVSAGLAETARQRLGVVGGSPPMGGTLRGAVASFYEARVIKALRAFAGDSVTETSSRWGPLKSIV